MGSSQLEATSPFIPSLLLMFGRPNFSFTSPLKFIDPSSGHLVTFCHLRCPSLKCLLHRWPFREALEPPCVIRVLLFQVGQLPVLPNPRYHVEPRNEGQVSNRILVSNQIVLSFQDAVEDLGYTFDLLDVTFRRRGDALRMEMNEPGCLSKVGALARCLEIIKLALQVFLGAAGEVKFIVAVILIDKVLKNGIRFPENDSRARILDGRNTKCKTISWSRSRGFRGNVDGR